MPQWASSFVKTDFRIKPHLVIRLLAKRQISNGLRSWITGPAIHNAWALKMLMNYSLSLTNALIVHQKNSLRAITACVTPLCDGWNSWVIRTCGQHRNMSPTRRGSVWSWFSFAIRNEYCDSHLRDTLCGTFFRFNMRKIGAVRIMRVPFKYRFR